MEEEKRLFKEMCKIEACIMHFGPVSAKNYSEALKIPYRKVLKAMHNLQEKGLVRFEKGYMPPQFSYECHELLEDGFLYCGWFLTEKGMKTDEYKEAEVKEMEIVNKVWGE